MEEANFQKFMQLPDSEKEKYFRNIESALDQSKKREENYKLQIFEAAKREDFLVLKLLQKEKEIHELKEKTKKLVLNDQGPLTESIYTDKIRLLDTQLSNKQQQQTQNTLPTISPNNGSLSNATTPTPSTDISVYTDPAINILYENLAKELKETRKKLVELTDYVNYYKLDVSSAMKELIFKCRTLIAENKHLTKLLLGVKNVNLVSEIKILRNVNRLFSDALEEAEYVIETQADKFSRLKGLCLNN